jgi:hypothetical protein
MMEPWRAGFSKEFNREFWYNSAEGCTTYINPFADERTMQGWSECMSQSHGAKYWHNRFTGATSWSAPANEKARVAIIVPFRDLHVEQKRSMHLKKFVAGMSTFLRSAFVPFKIFIVEQSDDKRKFNRGKLLNIGYDIAKREGFDTFIFHDVDLLPSLNMMHAYRSKPEGKTPVHIARVWNRYNNNPNYFGGIVSFSAEQFEAINGFPNNFWGWGGEDDEMIVRSKEQGLTPTAPREGEIEDMEDMSLEEKLEHLRGHQEWKCQKKKELLAEHKASWRDNGLSNLQDTRTMIQSTVSLNNECTKITVDIGLSGGKLQNHWSNQEAAVHFVNH